MKSRIEKTRTDETADIDIEQVRKAWSRKMTDTFTTQELADILFTPLVIQHIFWCEAIKTADLSAQLRVQELKTLTRKTRQLHRDYLSEMRAQLDLAHRNRLLAQVDELMADNTLHTAKLFFTIDNELHRQYPALPYDKIRAQAYMAQVFAALAIAHAKRINKWASPRFGRDVCKVNPHVTAANILMEAFIGDAQIEITQPIEIGVTILKNIFRTATFNIYED